MREIKKGQISVEYLIVVGFVTFVILGILGISIFYVSSVRDQLKSNQLTNFANKVISNSESVFYAGEPSQVVINAYLPEGVSSIFVFEESGSKDRLVFNITTEGGDSSVAFTSNVPIRILGSISLSEGLKKIKIKAEDDGVTIEETE